MNHMNMFPLPHPQTAGRVIDGEAVLILADSSEVQVLNPVGSRIFELADGTLSLEQIVQMVVDEYEVSAGDARRDCLEFVQDMVERQVFVLKKAPVD